MLVIEQVEPGSPAAKRGLKPGDRLLSIRDKPIHDIFDYQFHQDGRSLRFGVRRGLTSLRVTLRRREGEQLGLTFKPFRYRRCNNRCRFCFVDQLPPGLRPSLYFKDEDYRLSFLYGNYITCSNLSPVDIRRIISLRLSPLYISVHSTDEKVRKFLLGNARLRPIKNIMTDLAHGNIRMHTQIVICPGTNDGEELARTVKVLSRFYPHVRSIALIPAGFTRFRKGLPRLKAMTRDQAMKIVYQSGEWQEESRRKWGTRLIFPSDEVFLKAGMELPGNAYYEEYAQLENGVGMLAKLREQVKRRKRKVAGLKKVAPVTLVTGESAFPILKSLVRDLGLDRKVKIISIKNRFLGTSVTVSGLLAGRDIVRQLTARKITDTVLLPPNCLNDDGLFLDDYDVPALAGKLNLPVYTSTYDLIGSILKTGC